MDNILNVIHLVKHYEDVKAVDGVSLFIERGQIFGLLGPNGAGKTTTISAISQILPFNSGKIEIDGMDLLQQGEKIKQIVGYVPQDLAIYPTLTARENLQFFGSVYGLSGKQLNIRIDEALEFVGLTEHSKRKADTYSGGMKRRLNIASGLINHPKLLILDEPAVGVDPQSRTHILDSIKHLNEELGISVLYTSHYMEEVQQICQRVAIIDNGRIIADNELNDLIDRFGTGIIKLRIEENTEAAAKQISELEAVEEIRRDDHFITVSNKHPHRLLPRLLEDLNNSNVRVEEIEVHRSNLETVFLQLTGRSLRDE